MYTIQRIPLIIWVCTLAVSFLLISCSTSRRLADASYQRTLGMATANDLENVTRQMFAKYFFQIEQAATHGDVIYIESRWKERGPHADEAAIGVQKGRDRLLLEARPRTRSADTIKFYNVKLTAETMVSFGEGDEWKSLPLTADARNHLKAIADDFRTEINTGVRRY